MVHYPNIPDKIPILSLHTDRKWIKVGKGQGYLTLCTNIYNTHKHNGEQRKGCCHHLHTGHDSFIAEIALDSQQPYILIFK